MEDIIRYKLNLKSITDEKPVLLEELNIAIEGFTIYQSTFKEYCYVILDKEYNTYRWLEFEGNPFELENCILLYVNEFIKKLPKPIRIKSN
jgi:hypothetical protein